MIGRRATLMGLGITALFACSVLAETETQTKKTDWCTITMPKTIKVGEKVQMRVKLTGLLKGQLFVSCDLKDQNNKMMKWGGPPRALEGKGETVYQLPVRDRPELKSVYAYVAITRNKDDKKPLNYAISPSVAVAGPTVKVPECKYNKSWIWADATNDGKPLHAGDKLAVEIDYYLDPSEHFGKTTLYIWGTGPWIDTPDGKYAKKRGHINYRGGWKMLAGATYIEPGQGKHTFNLTIPGGLDLVKKYNPILFVCGFKNVAGTAWPWHVRTGAEFIDHTKGFFEITSEAPGNLFLYREPVRLLLKLRNIKDAGQEKTLRYLVHDVTETVVAEGELKFTPQKDGQVVPVDLKMGKRGAFVIQIDVPGWEKRHTTFARIPDVQTVTKGESTQFGMCNVTKPGVPERIEGRCQVAQRLGLTISRNWANWYRLQPGPDLLKVDQWIEPLEIGRKYGIEGWLCVVKPPAWAFQPQDQARDIGMAVFRCKWDAWSSFVKAATTQLKGKFFGWEWMNEIVPGGTPDDVGDYYKFCSLGTAAAKAVDPDATCMLASGLWPRSFRSAVLAAGTAKHVDVTAVHYGNGAYVRQARADLDAVGCDAPVWDAESARGVNTWGVPPTEQMTNTIQSNWILDRWTDELMAGVGKIIYFGGVGSATGGWDYMYDDLSPRPLAATLAVFVSKLHGTKPVGVFSLGKGGLFHLFERNGQALVVCSSYEKGETIPLHVGSDQVVMTDYQGNEQEIAAADGMAKLPLGPVRSFVEGGDLEALKAYVVPEIRQFSSGSRKVARVDRPRVMVVRGKSGQLPLVLRNQYDRELEGTCTPDLPDGWPEQEVTFALKPGEERFLPIEIRPPAGVGDEDHEATVSFRFSWDRLPQIDKPFVLSVLSPEMVGNMLPNGNFETPDATGNGPEGWRVDGKTTSWQDSAGLGMGLGRRVLKFTDTAGSYKHIARNIVARGAQTYLYTAWVWNKDMSAGSNIYEHLDNGERKSLHDVRVFTAGKTNESWQLFTARYNASQGLKNVTFCPVTRGSGWAFYDNLRVTLYEGTDYAAECHETSRKPTIDGKLGDWVTECPIPLLGRNQLTVKKPEYKWDSKDLSSVGYLMWDEANLYVAFEVCDEVHHATGTSGTGDGFLQGDCLILAFDPTNRGPAAATKAFAYTISSAVPGGGSGKHTIFLSEEHHGGMQPGHRLKDSSICEMAISQTKGACVYELRMPWSELGNLQPGFGRKFAFSVQLNDSDGPGTAAHLSWGGGLSPKWYPANFGVVTFVE